MTHPYRVYRGHIPTYRCPMCTSYRGDNQICAFGFRAWETKTACTRGKITKEAPCPLST